MKTTLDINSIQQINLFSRITGVSSKNCFNYSNSLIFVVDGQDLNRALGPGGENIRRVGNYLKRKIKIIREPDKEDLEKFIRFIVYPLKFKRLSVENGKVAISAGVQSKAPLIGRDHARLNELTSIVKQYFDIKEIRIV